MTSSLLVSALFLALPLFVSGVGHMIVVKLDVLPRLRIPLSVALFGANKTVRGFVVMPALTVVGVYLARALEPSLRDHLLVTLDGVDPVVLGVVLGLAYTLAELPNSYVKRRRGIAPGKLPEHNRLLHAFIDQADSAIACTLAYAALVSIPFSVLVVVTLVGPTLHLVTNLGLYSMGLRREPL